MDLLVTSTYWEWSLVPGEAAYVLKLLLILQVVLGPPTLLALLILSIVDKQRRWPITFAIALCISFAMWFLPFRFSAGARENGLQRAVHNAKPIIEAIEKYQGDKGRLPVSLSNLTPKYLEAIPETGMAGYKEFRYEATPVAASRQNYRLWIPMPLFIDFNDLTYLPESSMERPLERAESRYGDWVFFHD